MCCVEGGGGGDAHFRRRLTVVTNSYKHDSTHHAPGDQCVCYKLYVYWPCDWVWVEVKLGWQLSGNFDAVLSQKGLGFHHGGSARGKLIWRSETTCQQKYVQSAHFPCFIGSEVLLGIEVITAGVLIMNRRKSTYNWVPHCLTSSDFTWDKLQLKEWSDKTKNRIKTRFKSV